MIPDPTRVAALEAATRIYAGVVTGGGKAKDTELLRLASILESYLLTGRAE